MYVGQTANLRNRVANHMASSCQHGSPKERWIFELKQNSLRPIVHVLEMTPSERCGESEAAWIRMINPPLNVGRATNIIRNLHDRVRNYEILEGKRRDFYEDAKSLVSDVLTKWEMVTSSLAAGVAAERERAEKKGKD